ncbi:unnamed protein product [Orchesella dallaii]|uniref:Vitelline membrane outer layer protein 1 n=1 Tax=Orchesella dallaii TaxID=48710 RepID=A0ABP1QD10_9HEXA
MLKLQIEIFTLFSFLVVSTSMNIQVTNEVIWDKPQNCPLGQYVEGFQLKTHLFEGDTRVNGIKLFCGNPYQANTSVLISSKAKSGVWGKIHVCTRDYLNGFQLMVEKYQVEGDFTASNNVRFFCSKPPRDLLEQDEFGYGSWSSVQSCDRNQFICGLQTQYEQANVDDNHQNESIGNLHIECCNHDLPAM